MQQSYSRPALVAYIVDQLDSTASADELVEHVAAYLIDTGKTSDLESIMRDAQELRAQKYGVVELTASSAHKLDTGQVEHVEDIARRQYKSAKTVTLHQVQDQSAVGGVNLAFPHASLDLTVRAKLNQLREAIV